MTDAPPGHDLDPRRHVPHGSEEFYPEEPPVREVEVDGFWIDDHPVTVAEFRRFVKATGHVTSAELPPDPADYPGRRPRAARAGLDRVPPDAGAGPARRLAPLVAWVPGACWRQPEGPGSDVYTRATPPRRARHPRRRRGLRGVGGQGAADRGGVGARGARRPRRRASSRGATSPSRTGSGWPTRWHGDFPWRGHRRHVAGGHLPAQRLRALDMTGNVWEWTADEFDARTAAARAAAAPRPASTSRGASSRAARTCARPATACATAPPPGRASRSTPRPATSASAARCGSRWN